MWRMLFLRLKSLVLKAVETLKAAVQRNGLIVKATTLTFFVALLSAVIVMVLVFSFAPELVDDVNSLTESVINLEDAPIPYSGSFFSYILLNNIGHFWNPIRMLVWVPLFGSVLLGFEILLNGGVIGAVAVIVGVNRGVAYPVVGLVPHGIIEIPAFMLQIVCIVVWQVTVSEAIIAKLRGREIEKDKTRQGLQDCFVFAVTSIILFMVAAVVETYVTPYLLGI